MMASFEIRKQTTVATNYVQSQGMKTVIYTVVVIQNGQLKAPFSAYYCPRGPRRRKLC